MAGSQDLYGEFGSVPAQQPVDGSGARPLAVHATPENFGAQIGAGVQKVGAAGEQIGNAFGGMIMETASNQATLAYDKAAGDLHAKYTQLEGNAAEAARPQYTADLEALHQQYRGNLPLMAQKMFDATTVRSMGNQINEYSNYAAGQVKSANLNSHQAIMTNAVSHAGDLSTVLDPQRFGEEVIAPIVHGGNALAEIHGDSTLATGINADTGNYSYSDNPEGKAAEARHLAKTNAVLGAAYETAAKTIYDNQGASAAASWAKGHWGMMPDEAKVKMNQFLAPKMVNEDIESAIVSANSNLATKKQQQVLSNVPKSPTEALSVRNNNPGNLRDSATGQFRVFDTPESGTAAMQSDLTAKISGNSPAMEKNFGKGYSPTLSNVITTYAPPNENNTKAYIDTVSKETGFAPDQKLTVADIPKLQAAMSKVESGGSGSNIPQKQYTNDWERLTDQRQSFIDSAVNAITEKRGTDLGLIATTQKRAEANIDAQIRVAKGALDSDQKNIQGVIDGSLTKGKIPMTLEQLRSVPGAASLVDKVQREQPEFYNSILTRIAKAQHADATQNSPNAYDAILSALDTSGNHDRQSRIEYLSKGLGTENPGFSISQKDYNDAKPAIDLPDGQDTLTKHMKEIATANGNLDGKGQERAVAWYNQVMTAYKQKPQEVDDATFFNNIGEKNGPPAPSPPSRLEQLNNWARNFSISKPAIPTLTDKTQFDALKSGDVYTRNGIQYRKP